MRILVVEDDRETARYLQKALAESGHTVDTAHDGEDGFALARDERYDVLILDRMLPGRNGLSVLQSLREEGVRTPVLILSALGDLHERVEGLNAGSDDYLAKPFEFPELLARVEALARRAQPEEQNTRYVVADLVLDRLSHRVTRAGEAIPLQPREFRILEYLMRNAGRMVTRTMLLNQVWGYRFDPQTNVVDVHISRLRAKIDKNFDRPLLHTVRGSGYMISDRAA
jgi:two-component system, OmpR family, response regulator